MIPNWYGLALLFLAAYRTWRLLAEDTLTEPIRRRVLRGEKAVEFVTCPWCLGAWVGVVWWALWWWLGNDVYVAAVPFAISALVGAFALAVHRLEGD